jgi:catechol 2,3-dioxygenase-like lactoylglutathione lyase family enzyme
MLRGMSTMNLWAEDLAAATRWYTELLGVKPYFTSETAERGPGYVEFRIGDYQRKLGIIDRRFARPDLPRRPWRGNRLLARRRCGRNPGSAGLAGRQALQGITERGPGFVTASVVDPFGNVLASCTTAITSTSSATAEKRSRRAPLPP